MKKNEPSINLRSSVRLVSRVTGRTELMLTPYFLVLMIFAFILFGCTPVNDTKESDFALGKNDYQIDCDPSGDGETAFACQLAYYANRERQSHQEESDYAEPLDWSDDLAQVALDYSHRMCNEDFFDHNDPHGRGMESRLQEAGVFYVKAGENLARGDQLLPSEAMSMFMDEPACKVNHRGNVLDNDFTFTGVGTVFCGDLTIYTQLFATFNAEDLREDSNKFCSNENAD